MLAERNYTIDDSQWATPALQLSSGWNMLRVNGSDQYINSTQVTSVQPLLDNFWNSSMSWTTTAGSNTTLIFVGTDIWAYGLAGPGQGSYHAMLDNVTIGRYSALAAVTDYKKLLFEAHGLDDGPRHYLTLTNDEEASSLAFDVAIVQSAAAFGPSTDTESITSTLSSSALPSTLARPLPSSTSALPPSPYSASQLASLAKVYHLHWTPAAYFVVILACLLIAAFGIMVIQLLMRHHRHSATKRSRQFYASGIENPARTRPSDKVLNALRDKEISDPTPSDDAHTMDFTTSRDSGRTAGSSGSAREIEMHGW